MPINSKVKRGLNCSGDTKLRIYIVLSDKYVLQPKFKIMKECPTTVTVNPQMASSDHLEI